MVDLKVAPNFCISLTDFEWPQITYHCYLGQVFIWLNLYDIRLMSPTSLSILVIPVVASDLQFKCTQLNHDTGIRKFAYFCYSIFDPKTLVPLPILIDSPRFFEYEYLNQAHFSLTLWSGRASYGDTPQNVPVYVLAASETSCWELRSTHPIIPVQAYSPSLEAPHEVPKMPVWESQ